MVTQKLAEPLDPARIGYCFRAVLDNMGLKDMAVPDEYIKCVHGLEAHCKEVWGGPQPLYQRPAAVSQHEITAFHKRGQYYKVPREYRLVPEDEDCLEHWRLACKLSWPRARTGDDIDPILYAAFERTVQIGSKMHSNRHKWRKTVDGWLRTLDALDDFVRSRIGDDLKPISGKVRIASTAAILEVLRWEDTTFPTRTFSGHINGGSGFDLADGTTEMAPDDTGTFRPRGMNAHASLADLHAGLACKRSFESVGGGRVLETWSDPMPSTPAWNASVFDDVTAKATSRLRKCGVSPQAVSKAVTAAIANEKSTKLEELLSSVKDPNQRLELRKLAQCEIKSAAEARADPMQAMSAQMTVSQFETWASTRGGAATCRVAKRHCAQRGTDGKGLPKLRCCDDFTANGENLTVTLSETVNNPSFAIIARMAQELSWYFYFFAIIMPALYSALKDVGMAYRTVAVLPVPVHSRVITYHSLRKMQPVVQVLFGHAFGAKPGNNNFGRLSRLVCVISTTFYVVIVWAYVDDFLQLETTWGRATGHLCLDDSIKAPGWVFDEKKTKIFAESNKGLGALTDLSHVNDAAFPHATVSPDADSINDLLTMITNQKSCDFCPPGEAEVVVGKGRWLMQQTRARVGNAALQPWVQRASTNDANDQFSATMAFGLDFLEIALDPEFMTPLIFPMATAIVAADSEKLLIIHTDVSHHLEIENGRTVHVMWACVFLFDQATSILRVFYARLPEWYIQMYLDSPEKTKIYVGEIIGAIAIFYTVPHLLRHRKIIHFIDNAASLSSLANGYASKPEAAKFVNMFHVAIIALQCEWYGEWIPSKANPSDIMTRPDRFHELAEMFPGVSPEQLTFPPVGDDWSNLRTWAQTMRALDSASP